MNTQRSRKEIDQLLSSSATTSFTSAVKKNLVFSFKHYHSVFKVKQLFRMNTQRSRKEIDQLLSSSATTSFTSAVKKRVFIQFNFHH